MVKLFRKVGAVYIEEEPEVEVKMFRKVGAVYLEEEPEVEGDEEHDHDREQRVYNQAGEAAEEERPDESEAKGEEDAKGEDDPLGLRAGWHRVRLGTCGTRAGGMLAAWPVCIAGDAGKKIQKEAGKQNGIDSKRGGKEDSKRGGKGDSKRGGTAHLEACVIRSDGGGEELGERLDELALPLRLVGREEPRVRLLCHVVFAFRLPRLALRGRRARRADLRQAQRTGESIQQTYDWDAWLCDAVGAHLPRAILIGARWDRSAHDRAGGRCRIRVITARLDAQLS